MVGASRRHLTERYASGVDLLLWETEKRLIPDLDAIRSVTEAAASGRAEGLDMGAALALVQAVRLGLDRLECELFASTTVAHLGVWTGDAVSLGVVITAIKKQISKRSGSEFARLTRLWPSLGSKRRSLPSSASRSNTGRR